jgi:cobalt-zinc-cadmium efflux system outer membrane protein
MADACTGMLKTMLFIVMVTLFCEMGAGQQPTAKLTLNDVLTLANQHNLDLVAARAKRAAALAGVRIAKERPNPTLTVGGSRDLPHENVLLDQSFELGLKRSKRIEVARGEQALNDLETDILARQIRRRTREAFYNVLLAQAQSQQAADALKLAQRLQQISHDRFAVGDIAQLEVMQSDLEVARADVDNKVLLQEVRTARSQLATLLNQPEASLGELEGAISDLPPALDETDLVQKAHASNPDIQHIVQERTIEASRLSSLKWQRVPNIDIQGGVDLNAPPDFHVGPRGQVAMSLPIFSRNQGEIAQSNANLNVLDLSLAASRRTVEGSVEAAYLDVAAKRTQVELYRDNLVPATLKLEAMAEESYQAGKSNVLTVIDAQRRTNDIKRAYLDSLFSFQSAFANLEEVVGVTLGP